MYVAVCILYEYVYKADRAESTYFQFQPHAFEKGRLSIDIDKITKLFSPTIANW